MAAALAKVTVIAALTAPAMCSAGVDDWANLMYGLVRVSRKACGGRARVPTPRLHELLAHALRCLSPEMWLPGFQRLDPRAVSNLLWAYATAGYQGSVIALVTGASSVFAALLRGSAEQRPIPQDISNALWALVSLGCHKGSQPDITPLLASVVYYMQQGGMQEASPQGMANVSWGLAKCRLGLRPDK